MSTDTRTRLEAAWAGFKEAKGADVALIMRRTLEGQYAGDALLAKVEELCGVHSISLPDVPPEAGRLSVASVDPTL